MKKGLLPRLMLGLLAHTVGAFSGFAADPVSSDKSSSTMPACEPFVYPPEALRSTRYRCRLNNREHVVLDSARGHVVRAAGGPGVDVDIENDGPVKSCVVRPRSLGIEPRFEGNHVHFRLKHYANLSIEINGANTLPLFLFYDAPVETPSPDARTVVFRAGRIYETGAIAVSSGQRIFIEGGAIVRGTLVIENAEDVQVRGPGVLDQSNRNSRRNTLYVRHSRNVVIEDVLLLDTFGWSLHLSFSEQIDIRRVRIIGWRANCDGIDILSSSNVAVQDCFFRNADDCIAIKSGKWDPDPEGIMENISIERCVLWNDTPGNAFEIGFELDNQSVRKVRVSDCDIIHVMRGAVVSIHNAGKSRVEDVCVEGIRIEDARDEFVDLYVGLSVYSPDRPLEYFIPEGPRRWVPPEHQDPISPDNKGQWWLPLDQKERGRFAGGRGSISGIRFDRISFESRLAPIILSGYDDEHSVSNVSFSGISLGGKTVMTWPSELLRMRHALDITLEGQPISKSAGSVR